MDRAGDGSIRRRRSGGPAIVIAVVATSICSSAVRAQAPASPPQPRQDQSFVGSVQRVVGSIPIINLLVPAPRDPATAFAPPSGMPPGSRGAPPVPPAPILGQPATGPIGAPVQLAPPTAPGGPFASIPVAITPATPKEVPLQLAARYGRDAAAITGGVVWRVYPVRPDPVVGFRPLREDRSAAPNLNLPPGDYVVHASFGLASAAKAVHLANDAVREVFELPAGGLRLEGRVGNMRIPAGQIVFDVFRGSQFEAGEKRQIAQGVATGDVVVVPEGTYHVVSNYGDSNAVVRSDIKVQTGKLTDVTVTHRAAVITLKLVSDSGGDALANTSWTVLTPGGDVIKESIGAFPRVVLAEGDYRAIARHEDKTFERDFKVATGIDGEVELLAR